MTFIIDKEELKPGLIIFRRRDVVEHKNWYCRIKLPKADRYKTVSLKTSDLHDARNRAYDYDVDVRFRLKHDVPIFDKSFSEIAKDYTDTQRIRAKMGEITLERVKKIESVIKAQLNPYAGSTQISLLEGKTDGRTTLNGGVSTGKGRSANRSAIQRSSSRCRFLGQL